MGASAFEVLIDNVGSQLVEGRAVHELGAGVGNTGILVAKCINMKSLVMTDFNEEILENLQYNVDHLNRGLLAKMSR